jgi:uncharacterized membrane protein YdjX (TVP38/TMEM64 family)
MAEPAKSGSNFKFVVLVFAAAAYLYLPGIQDFIKTGFVYLKHRDFESLRLFILSYGLWAPATSIALMALQSLIPLVPGIVITITNAWIFGWQFGALYSWVGALLGAMMDFIIARWYGRPVVERLINLKHLAMTDEFFNKHGMLAVFVTRLIPVIPFKIVSYGAGLTEISLRHFAFATGVGQIPAIVLYSFLGQNMTKSIKVSIAVTSVFIIAGIVVYYYRDIIVRRIFSNKD